MADEPEEPEDESRSKRRPTARREVSALAELALCENLSQTSGWAARWSATMAGADATLLWAPDTVHPLFLCIGASGEGVEKLLRRSAPRETRATSTSSSATGSRSFSPATELASDDPFVRGRPRSSGRASPCRSRPRASIVGLLALFFTEIAGRRSTALARLERFLEQAAPALGRALRAERKTVGMLHAIERLTNLYDLSKAFGSTIDIERALRRSSCARPPTSSTAEVGLALDRSTARTSPLAATAVNDNYDVESPPDAVGASVVGDVIADQETLRRNRIPPTTTRLHGERRLYPIHSVLAVPLVEDEVAIGALVARQQARPPSRVLGRGRGAARRPRAPGRPRAPRRPASTRPRRRSRSSTRCSPSAARSRRRSTSTRSCRRSSTPPRR